LFIPAVFPIAAEIRDVLKSSEIDAKLAGLQGTLALHERPNFAVWLMVHDGKAGPLETRAEGDNILHIRRGKATITLAGRKHQVAAGDMVHIPRNTEHRIDPGNGRIEYVVVRIFPSGEGLSPRRGARMQDVLTKSEIDAAFAKHDSNQPIHSSPNYTMNYVIYTGRSGPYEAHRGCVDIYFMRVGTGTAHLGGEIVNAKEETPGEIRGDAVKSSRTYTIGPGDMVVIPRTGVHHMVPTTPKLGYVLLKVWAD
jgi:mannose-6-phosphate isomerase-like protein (cupin superfamily)